jgi:hypothetical protein
MAKAVAWVGIPRGVPGERGVGLGPMVVRQFEDALGWRASNEVSELDRWMYSPLRNTTRLLRARLPIAEINRQKKKKSVKRAYIFSACHFQALLQTANG